MDGSVAQREDVTDDLAAQGEGALVDVGVQQGDGEMAASGRYEWDRILLQIVNSPKRSIRTRRFSTGAGISTTGNVRPPNCWRPTRVTTPSAGRPPRARFGS